MRLSLITGSLLLVIMASALWLAQASDDEPAELDQEETRISDIQENATAYNGSMVVIEGAIELECAAGCWFIVNDGTGSIFVDILPNNFVIPQESGEDAKVYGEVTIKNNESQIIGKIVKIGGEVYQ